jgi:E3 ubiquitin-protein ligase synoviolin
MPIHIIRDVAYTVQSFYKRITDFVKYRHATRDMNERYPDATAEQIGREDTCIICREVMREWQPNAEPPMEDRLRPKKLPCGHVLHLACLRSWLERQQNCPTCRQNVLEDPPRRENSENRANPAQRADNRAADGQPPRNGRPAARQNRNAMRFLNLGPLRIGFGAGNIQDLQREMNQRANREGRQGGNQDPLFRRNLGAGANIGGQQGANQSSDISNQIRGIERQLLAEANINTLQQEELRVLRAMQGELARLRIREAAVRRGETDTIGLPPPPILPPLPSIWQPQPNNPIPSIQAYTGRPPQSTLNSGHPDLPQGVTIPEGWTLMPLEPLNGGSPAPPASSEPAAQDNQHQGSNLSAENAAVSRAPSSSLGSEAQAQTTTQQLDELQGPNSAQNHASSSEQSSRPNGVSIQSLVHPTPTVPVPQEEHSAQTQEDHVTVPSIPQWGSTRSSSSTLPTMNGSDGADSVSTQEHMAREDKGKARVPTVEDAQDDGGE